MKFKMNVKTILLFSALFILGTMILGFYSCSGGTATPVSPQLTDDTIADNPLPGDSTTIITDDGDAITITTEDGTTIVTYIVTIDDNGNPIITTRESQIIADGNQGLLTGQVELTFTDFVPDGPNWTGTATITNKSPYLIHYPRVVIGPIPMDPIEGYDIDFETVHFIDVIQDPDIYCGLYQRSSFPVPAYPTIFVADEDENYQIPVDGAASHEISLKYEGIPKETFVVFLVYENQLSAEDIFSSVWGPKTIVPSRVDIEFVEYVDGASVINITLGIDPENWVHNICIVEDTFSQETYTFAFGGFNPDLEPVFTGSIEWNPAVDGTINIMAYFPGEFLHRKSSDTYMDFTSLS